MNANATITKTIETYGAGSIFERTVIRFRAGTRAAEIWLPISGRVTAYDRASVYFGFMNGDRFCRVSGANPSRTCATKKMAVNVAKKWALKS